jgi:hypothetical protein
VERLAPRMSKPGRRKGHAFGAALEMLRANSTSLVDDPFGMQEMLQGVIEEAYADVHPNNQEESDAVEFEQHVIPLLAIGYADRYGLKGRREVEYLLPLTNPDTGYPSRTWRLGGKIDGLENTGKYETVPHYRLIEDKLMSQIQKPMIDRLPLDHQISEYIDALVTKDPFCTFEVEYRFTRWPSIRRKQTETLDDFCSRFTEDLEARPEFYFISLPVVFPDDHLQDFRRGRWGVGQLIREAQAEYAREDGRFSLHGSFPPDRERHMLHTRDRIFPMNPSRCWEYGGCEFIPLCTKREGAIDLYVVQEDNPELTIDKGDESVATDTYATQE